MRAYIRETTLCFADSWEQATQLLQGEPTTRISSLANITLIFQDLGGYFEPDGLSIPPNAQVTPLACTYLVTDKASEWAICNPGKTFEFME